MGGHHLERQSAHGYGVAGAQPFHHRRVEIGAGQTKFVGQLLGRLVERGKMIAGRVDHPG